MPFWHVHGFTSYGADELLYRGETAAAICPRVPRLDGSRDGVLLFRIQVFFSVMAGAFSIGSALPYLNTINTAIGVAKALYGVIDRVPEIDSYSKSGIKPEHIAGQIEIRNIDFTYPSRPGVKVSVSACCHD